MAKTVYAGSFDPYTIGHHSIVKMASEIFDEVHILICVNSAKKRKYDAHDMKKAVESTLKNSNITNCKVIVYDDLVAKYCKENHIEYLVRGLRNSMDFAYEENIAKINRTINRKLKTLYLRAENEAISSSMVKELDAFDVDISNFVPLDVYVLIKHKRN